MARSFTPTPSSMYGAWEAVWRRVRCGLSMQGSSLGVPCQPCRFGTANSLFALFLTCGCMIPKQLSMNLLLHIVSHSSNAS